MRVGETEKRGESDRIEAAQGVAGQPCCLAALQPCCPVAWPS